MPRMRSWSCSARLTATALAFSRPVERPAASTPARTARATMASTAALTMTSISAKPASPSRGRSLLSRRRRRAITCSIDRAPRRVEAGWTNVGHGYPGLTMMGRRLLLLVAVLMGLTALAASVAPRDNGTDEPATPPGRPGAAVQPSQTPELAPARPQEDVVEETLSTAKGASFVRVRARPGQTVKLQVQGRVFDEVLLT